jgi:hypothetical protein
MQVLAGVAKGSGVQLEKKSMADQGGEVIDKSGRDCHEVGCEEKKGLFVFGFGEAEAVSVHWV